MASPVVHFEIHASQPERALAFYANVFGWTHNDVPGMEQQYWLVFPTAESPGDVASHGPSQGIGGGMLIRQGEPPLDGQAVNAFVCILQVEDLDACYHGVIEHGGGIALEPMDIPGVGRVFYGKDTEGNIFGVMQPAPSDLAQAA